jgi:hypothetical protein
MSQHVHVFGPFDTVRGEAVVFRCKCGVYKTQRRSLRGAISARLYLLGLRLRLRRIRPEEIE